MDERCKGARGRRLRRERRDPSLFGSVDLAAVSVAIEAAPDLREVH